MDSVGYKNLKKFFFSDKAVDETTISWLKKQNEKLAENGIVLLNKQMNLTTPAFFEQLQSEKKQILFLSPTTKFKELAKQYIPQSTIWNIGFYPTRKKNKQNINKQKELLKKFDLVIIGFANERQLSWIKCCLAYKKKIYILAIDNDLMLRPYLDKAIFSATCFSYHPPAINKLFHSVFITGKFKGKLPYYFDQDGD